MNTSWRYPASPKQPDRLRGINRNETLLIDENAIKLYPGDIVSYGGYLYQTNAKPVIYSYGSTWAVFNMTFNYHELMSYHIPVDKTDLFKEDKTTQFIDIYKSHPAIIQLETFPNKANRTIHLALNIDDKNGTYPLLFYGCNSSVNPYTVDYTTDSNCAFYGTRTDFDTKNIIIGNSSYVHLHAGIDENGKVSGTSLTPSDTMFIYLDSDAPNVAKGFKLYYADDVVADNTNFNETYYLHTYSPSSWTNRSETPDVIFQVSADQGQIQYYIYACDNLSNCVNSTIQLDLLGTRPNEAPNAPYLIQPLVNYNVSGTYNITWLDGEDPEGDDFNITLILINHTDESEYVLTNTVSKGTEYYLWDTTAYTDLSTYQIVIYATDSGGLNSVNDTSEGNFTIDNVDPSVSIIYPIQNQYIRGTTLWINGTASDTSPDTIIINNTDWGINQGTYTDWSFKNTSTIIDGVYTIKITANDSAGNVNIETRTFIVDNTNPSLTITPGNNTINNTIVTIEGTASDTNFDTIYSNNTDWDWNSDYSNWAFTNNTNIADGIYHILITANDSAGNTESSLFVFTFDTANPIITINPSNAFTATNTSTINNYKSTEFPLNITFEDERDLFAMEINITNSTGQTVFNRTNTSLSGLTYDYTEIINNSDWTAGLYNIEVIISDSHTASKIGDYELIKQTDKLIFNTKEKNLVTIEADDAISSDTTKVYDRYQFEFSYPKEKTTDIVYHVKSDNKIYYKPDSGYKAHFIIWNEKTKTGNWIDFEDVALKDYSVKKISDNDYTVTFKMPVEGIDTIKFNSIGGLNVVTKNYEWFRGSTAQSYTSPVLTNTTTSFYLNVTNTSTISDIDARFFYNYTEYSVTETTSDDYDFEVTITSPAIALGAQIFNFTWNVSINQTDGTQYTFSELNNQTVSTAQINVTMLDELNHSLITETLDVYYVGEGRHYTTDTGYVLIGNLSPSIPYIEIENDNYPRRGYYITISENITTYLTAYLLRSTASTQETIFTIQDSDLSRIEGAKMTFYRMVNMTYVEVGQVETDYAGQTALTLDTTNKYRIVIEADGYPIKTLELRPLQTTYTITLQITGAGFENVFEGIAYTITPTNRSRNVSENYTDFRLDIYSSNSDLELFGVRTFDHNYTCIPASCTQNITGSPAGGSAIVRVKGNTTGTVKIDVYYKRTDYPITYLNFNIFSFVNALVANARSLWASMNTIKGDYSPIMLALISIVGTIMLLGTAAEIGIYGLPLIVIAAFGLIFFAIVGFLSPFIVGLSLILGGIVYFRFSGGAD